MRIKDADMRLPQNKIKFIEGIMEKGLSKKDAAIYAGVAPGNAHVYGTRWSQDPAVRRYIDAIYEADINQHRETVWTAITQMKRIVANSSSEQAKIQAAKLLLDWYRDSVVQEQAVKELSNSVVTTLYEMINNAVPVRTEADLDD